MLFGNQNNILWFGFRIMGYTYGAMLGVFLLAVWTKTRGADFGNTLAMATSIALVIFLTADLGQGMLQGLRGLVLSPLGITQVAWPWTIVIGTLWTFGVGSLWKTPKTIKAS